MIRIGDLRMKTRKKLFIILLQGEKFIRAFDTVKAAWGWNQFYYGGDLEIKAAFLDPSWLKEATPE